jgi:hypothetical protein
VPKRCHPTSRAPVAAVASDEPTRRSHRGRPAGSINPEMRSTSCTSDLKRVLDFDSVLVAFKR